MKLNRLNVWIATLALLIAAPVWAAVDQGHLEEYGKGIIEDYSNMEHGDLEWVWIAPGINLSEYKIDVGEFENLSEAYDGDMMETLNEGMRKALERMAPDSPKGTLTTENAVFWAERANSAKRWIPFAGGHVAQAGVGLEMVFRNSEGEVVAKLRHSGREGSRLSDAAWELIDEIADWAHSH
ncbi:MAG: hypothetical protein R3338_09570 [Thermoanaerobaculia bacterium]|nr:hypothetical protein [Thermoanaerobaculia bacterium]